MRSKSDRQVATIVDERTYVSIRLAAAMENKSVSEWFRDVITPRAAAAAKRFAAKQKRRKGARA